MTDLVHIDSLTFDGEGGSDFVYSSLDGWYSGAPLRNTTKEYPNGDGGTQPAREYRSPRSLTFVGGIAAGSFVDMEAVADQFAAIQADGAPIPVTVETDRGPRTVTASLSGRAEIEEHVEGFALKVTAQFICADPVKYGPAVPFHADLPSSGGGLEYNLYSGGAGGKLYYGPLGNLGRVTLTNSGTADVWPVYVVTGPLDAGFYIQCLDGAYATSTIRYDRVVPAGSTVTIDSATGEVLVDGVSDASTYLTRDEFFPAPRMASCTVQLNAISGGSGYLDGVYSPGWL